MFIMVLAKNSDGMCFSDDPSCRCVCREEFGYRVCTPASIQRPDWCETMDRPKSQCGCPDCGSSLIELPDGVL